MSGPYREKTGPGNSQSGRAIYRIPDQKKITAHMLRGPVYHHMLRYKQRISTRQRKLERQKSSETYY